jgi:hypothetical protein
MEQCSVPLALENVPGNIAISAPILPRERELSLAHAQKCIFLFMEKSYRLWKKNFIQVSTAISAIILPRERELSLGHAQR